jgi:hypothetical protein
VGLLRESRGKDFTSGFRDLAAQLGSPDVVPGFILLSSLVVERERVAEAIDELRAHKAGVTVVYPKRPWRDAETLAEGYLMSQSQEKLLRFAESNSCGTSTIPFRMKPTVPMKELERFYLRQKVTIIHSKRC